MTQRSSRSGIPPIIREPPIAEELDKLREKPPRASKNEPLDQLERLAILNGLRDGDAPIRIAVGVAVIPLASKSGGPVSGLLDILPFPAFQ